MYINMMNVLYYYELNNSIRNTIYFFFIIKLNDTVMLIIGYNYMKIKIHDLVKYIFLTLSCFRIGTCTWHQNSTYTVDSFNRSLDFYIIVLSNVTVT